MKVSTGLSSSPVDHIALTTMNITCITAWVAIVLTLPLIVLFHITATPQQHAKRLRGRGLSYKAIGEQLGFSATKARKLCLA